MKIRIGSRGFVRTEDMRKELRAIEDAEQHESWCDKYAEVLLDTVEELADKVEQ